MAIAIKIQKREGMQRANSVFWILIHLPMTIDHNKK